MGSRVGNNSIISAIQGVIWVAIHNGICVIFPFFIRSIIIKKLGISYIGMSTYIISIIQILNLSELGIGQAIVVNLYRPVIEKDYELVKTWLLFYKKIYRIIGCIILVIGCFLPAFVIRVNHIVYPSEINIYYVFYLYLLQILAMYFVIPECNALYIASNKVFYYYRVNAVIWCVVYILQIVCLYRFTNFYLYLVLIVLGTIVCQIVDGYLSKRVFYEYYTDEFSIRKIDSKLKKSFVKKIIAIALSKLRIIARESIDSITITIFLGLVTAGCYQNYIMILNVPILVINSLVTGITPYLATSFVSDIQDNAYITSRRIALIIHFFALYCSGFLIFYYQRFIEIWIGKDYLLSPEIVILLATCFYCKSISEKNSILRNASGIWWEGIWICFVECIINIVLNIIFVNMIGLSGVIIGTILSICFINIPFEGYYLQKLCFKKNLCLEIIMNIKGAINFIVSGSVIFIISKMCVNDIKAWIIGFIVCIIIPTVSILCIYCNDKDFLEIKKYIINKIKK